MENRTNMTLAEQFAAAQDWWRDAGVDQDFTAEVQVMLAEEEETASRPAHTVAPATVAEAEPAPPKLLASDLPDSLEAFQAWWIGETNPFGEDVKQAVPARGAAGSPVMVLVPMPEADDGEALLSGLQGRFVASVLRAMGIDAETAYFASALPGHMPLPDWERLGSEGLGAALAHHIGLAGPDRVILFGSKLPALLGHDPAAPPEAFARVSATAALTTFAPDRLLDHARQRAKLWQRLLEWTVTP